MKINKSMWMIFVLIIIAGLAYGSLGVSKSLFSISDGGSLPKFKYIEVPSFGYLECGSTSPKSVIRSFGAEKVRITCASDKFGPLLGLTDGCTVTLIAPDQTTFLKRDYGYVINRNGINSEQKSIPGGVLGYHGETVSIPLGPSDYVLVAYGGALFDKLLAEGQKYIVSGSPYAIHIHDVLSPYNGQILPNSRVGSCILEDNYFKNREIEYFDPSIKELSNLPSKQLDFRSLNEPNGIYTYMSHFTPMPSFSQMVEERNGKQVYCMNNQLFPIYQIKVNDFMYNLVNYQGASAIATVTCCNGDSRPGYTCQDHNWIENSKTECDLSKGIICKPTVFQPLDSKTYYRYSCVDHHCQKETITTKCTYDSDCKDTEVCLRNNDPSKNRCISGGVGAGSTTPFSDKKKEIDWVPFAILGGSLFAGLALAKQKQNGGLEVA